MQKPSPKPLRSLWLASAGLAPALALLLLGASASQLAARQSADFNTFQGGTNDIGFFRYAIDPTNGYGTPSFTAPTNPASAGNYAYRIVVPAITNDPNHQWSPRAGGIRKDVWYGQVDLEGDPDPNLGRYSVGADLVGWYAGWENQILGVGTYMQETSFNNISVLASGYLSGNFNLVIASLMGLVSGIPDYSLWGSSAAGSTVLDPTHQYRLVMSSHDGKTHLLQLFDKWNTNTAWQSAIGADAKRLFASQTGSYYGGGYCGVLVANLITPPPVPVPIGGNTNQGADATFDNYYAYLPALDDTPAALPPVVTDTYPPPCGKAPEFYPTVSVKILNREYNVVSNTMHLYLDGALIPDGDEYREVGTGSTNAPYYRGDGYGVHKPAMDGVDAVYPQVFPGATITYQITNLFPNLSVHTNMVVFQSEESVWYTNSWTWTSAWPYLWASNSLPLGALSATGFGTRTVQSLNANLGEFPGIINSAAGAQMLLGPNTFAIDVASTNWVQTVAWTTPGNQGGGITNFPGLCPSSSAVRSFVVQAQAYLQLAAGTNDFHVHSDDCVGIYSGATVMDTSIVMFQNQPAVIGDFDFYIVAEAAGLYPVNFIYEQGAGGAECVLYSRDSGGTLHLVNDVANGGIPAYYAAPASALTSPALIAAATQSLTNGYWNPTNWNLMSSSVVRSNSNYSTTVSATLKSAVFPTVTTVPLANVVPTTAPGPSCAGDLIVTGYGFSGDASMSGMGTNTITCALPGSQTYYRLYGPGSHQILSCVKSNANLVITYKWQR